MLKKTNKQTDNKGKKSEIIKYKREEGQQSNTCYNITLLCYTR